MFTDWVDVKEWKSGAGPVGANGTSAVLDLQLLWAYQVAADLETKVGNPAFASQYLSAIEILKKTIRAKYWDSNKKLFADRRVWVRQILVAGLAGAVAWQIGDLVIRDGGVVAAIVCTLSIRISLHKSVREGFGQIVGTAIGASVALLNVSIFVFGFIAVGLTVIFCAVVARALHLGEVASVNVPVTALIVIGPGISGTTATHRLGSTLIGAAIAIVFSYFSHANTPVGRAIDQITDVSAKAAELLAKMSEGVAAGYTQKEAGNWLAKARLLMESVPSIRAQSVEARGHARWFPTAEKDEAEEVYIQGIAIEHTLVQVRTIARTLFDSAVSGGIADSTKKQIGLSNNYVNKLFSNLKIFLSWCKQERIITDIKRFKS